MIPMSFYILANDIVVNREVRMTRIGSKAVAAAILLGCSALALGAASAQEGPKVGIFVADSFGDRAFFDIALRGKELIEKNHAATVATYEGRLQADKYFRQLSDAGRANDFVFVLGFEAIDAMLEAAAANPEAHFIFIDSMLGDPSVSSVGYRDSEGCFLIGALAARVTASGIPGTNPEKVVGFVGGVDAPVIRDCQSGYEQGATTIDSETKVVSAYVGSFTDPAKGKTINQSLNQEGSDINYQYAGLSGEGGFDNVKEGGAGFALGAGFDQAWLAPGYVPGSMLKNVDLTIDHVTRDILAGTLKKGFHFSEGVKEGGLAVVTDAALVSPEVSAEVAKLAKQIVDGEIEVRSAL
jgi:basic membrane protein A